MKYSMLGFVLALVIGLFAATPVYAELTSVDLEKELMCYCDCAKVLASCQCETAGEMRSSIGEMIEQGQTKQQILDYFVAQHGETILAIPTNIDLEKELMCYCDCDKVLASCQCGTAGEMRSSVGEMIEKGGTEQQILSYFVAEHGEKILANPSEAVLAITTKKGFNLGVWIPLSVATAGGAAALYFILRRRVWKGKAAK